MRGRTTRQCDQTCSRLPYRGWPAQDAGDGLDSNIELSMWNHEFAPAFSAPPHSKLTGLAQPQASNRDFQSKRWANLRNLGQPCGYFDLARPGLLHAPASDATAPNRDSARDFTDQYVRSTLGFKTDLQYNLFGHVCRVRLPIVGQPKTIT